MVGEDVADDAGITARDLLGMVDVIVDVNRDEFAEFAVVEQFLRAMEGGFVDVIVTGAEDDAVFRRAGLERFEFGDGGCDGFLDENVFAGVHREGRVVGVGFQVGQHENGVDGGIGDDFLGGSVGLAAETQGLVGGQDGIDGPDTGEFRAGAMRDGFAVEQGNVSGADEGDAGGRSGHEGTILGVWPRFRQPMRTARQNSPFT